MSVMYRRSAETRTCDRHRLNQQESPPVSGSFSHGPPFGALGWRGLRNVTGVSTTDRKLYQNVHSILNINMGGRGDELLAKAEKKASSSTGWFSSSSSKWEDAADLFQQVSVMGLALAALCGGGPVVANSTRPPMHTRSSLDGPTPARLLSVRLRAESRPTRRTTL